MEQAFALSCLLAPMELLSEGRGRARALTLTTNREATLFAARGINQSDLTSPHSNTSPITYKCYPNTKFFLHFAHRTETETFDCYSNDSTFINSSHSLQGVDGSFFQELLKKQAGAL